MVKTWISEAFGLRGGLRGFGAEPGQVQQGSGEGPGEGSGRLWCRARSGSTGLRRRFRRRLREALVQPGQVQQGSGEGSRRRSEAWCRAKSGSTGFRRRFWEVLAQSHVQQGSREGSGDGRLWCSQFRFNRAPEKVPDKVWEALVQSQVRFNRVPEKFPEKIPGNLGAEPIQVQQGSGESSGEGVGFGAEPSQVQRGSEEGSGEGVGGFGAEPG